MTLSVRLPTRVEQELATYCHEHNETRSALVQSLIEEFLASRQARDANETLTHPFIGHDEGTGEDVSGTIKQRLRERFREAGRLTANVVLADSGFLVALGVRRDPRHGAAVDWLAGNKAQLLIPAPVIVETCFFLSVAAKSHLLSWVRRSPAQVLDVPAEAYPEIAHTLEKYADLDPDFTDAALVWAAHASGCRRILTVDRNDFETYRLKGNRSFDVLPWAN